MNAPLNLKTELAMPAIGLGDGAAKVKLLFRYLMGMVILGALLFLLYWLFASDRYVSRASLIIRTTDPAPIPGVAMDSFTNPMLAMYDQVLLREHLVSVDMLKKLDSALNLRGHFSDSSNDIASRMWFEDASIEWFHRHFLNRVEIQFDEFDGILRITTEAYSPKMAHAITSMLVEEGGKYMNQMSHDLAQEQVRFLDAQVETAKEQALAAREALIHFQNNKGLHSPKASAENLNRLIGELHRQRTSLETKLAALPKTLDKNHPTRRTLAQSLAAVEKQITEEEAKLASSKGKTLNSLVEEEDRLVQEVEYKQELYKTALVALEKGRMDAARTIKHVSILQQPTEPEYPWQPRRIYGICATICITALLLGVLALLRSVVLDHVD